MNASREGLAASQSGAKLCILHAFIILLSPYLIFFQYGECHFNITMFVGAYSLFSFIYIGGKRERDDEPNYEEEEQMLRDVGALGE